ncbi:hypothetical protein AC579_4508 [Pseudocercospora musae]|uniref:FAD-binding FR-type domain-containing protein n=1 Tax=Pseudocercospora musae TaxID=113226 RepID=A0A139IDJ7_9PEZI|nr:hypothetical protein AC579_4508 [Pseudocercospora musae]
MDDPFISLVPVLPTEFRSDINLIRSEVSSRNTTEERLTPEQRKHFQSLVEGFQFSRWFFVTYQAAVLVIVLSAAAYRWQERRSRRRRARRKQDASIREEQHVKGHTEHRDTIEAQRGGASSENISNRRQDSFATAIYTIRHEDGWASSSSSSTREGDATPPTKPEPDDEVSPLSPLLRQADQTSGRHRSRVFRPWSYTKAILTYQPPSLPILHRIIPSNSTSLVVMLLLGLNLFYLLFGIDLSTLSAVDVLADRAGLLFVANLPWLYLMAAKTQPIKRLTGDSYENLNLIHRRQGEWLCFLAVVHFGGMVVAWYNFLQSFLTLWGFLTIHYIAWGVGAFVAYEALYLTSLSSFREWWYEVFLVSHVFLQAAALVLLWMHHFRAGPYAVTALLIFVLDRLVWRLGLKSTSINATLNIMEDGETVKVSGDWPVLPQTTSRWRKWLGQDMRFGWFPSEHVFITVPGISRKHRLQFHPMTIASAAPLGNGHAWFNLIIRAKGGFSRDLLNYARTFPSTTVLLDGPYGSLHALEMLEASDTAIIVAGGSGLAVAYPMLWHLVHLEGSHRPNVAFIWIVQDASHISWIGTERLEELRRMRCRVVLPPPSRKHGRPDVCALLRDTIDEIQDGKVGVVVSGPDGMNRDVRNSCASMIWEGRDVEVTVEKFGW